MVKIVQSTKLPKTKSSISCKSCNIYIENPGHGRSAYCKQKKNETQSVCARIGETKRRAKAREKFQAKLPDNKAYERCQKAVKHTGLKFTRGKQVPGLMASPVEVPLETALRHPSELEEYALHTLRNLRESLVLGEEVRIERSKLQELVFCLSKENEVFARWLDAHYEGILRDVGGPTFQQAHKRARLVTEKWWIQADYLQAAIALLTEATLWRAFITNNDDSPNGSDLRKVKRWAHAADLLAEVYCRNRNPRLVKLVRHQAVRTQVRVVAIYAQQPKQASQEMELLRRLTQELDEEGFETYRVQAETLEEEVAYHIMLGDFEKAEEHLKQLDNLWEAIPFNSPYSHLSRLRIKIELLLAQKALKNEEAIEHIKSYLAIWQEHPTSHHHRVLKRWQQQLGEKCPPVPEGSETGRRIYSTGLLPFSYFEGGFAAV